VGRECLGERHFVGMSAIGELHSESQVRGCLKSQSASQTIPRS
jgi:hypothetical protein